MVIGGILYIKVDSQMLLTADGEFKFNLGLTKYSPEKSMNNVVAGFSGEPQVPSIEGEILLPPKTDVAKIVSTKDATVVAELANGGTLILSRARQCGEGEFTSKGRLEVKFIGMEMEYVKG